MYIIHTKMEGRLILDVIAWKCATILKLFTGVKMSHCRSGRGPFLLWILALTLLIVSEDLTSRAICLIHYPIGMVCAANLLPLWWCSHLLLSLLPPPSKIQDKEADSRQSQGKDSGQESKTKIYFHALHISSGLFHRYVCVQLIKQNENAGIS